MRKDIDFFWNTNIFFQKKYFYIKKKHKRHYFVPKTTINPSVIGNNSKIISIFASKKEDIFVYDIHIISRTF